MLEAHGLVATRLSELGAEESVKAVLASIFLPESKFDLVSYRQTASRIEDVCNDDQTVLISVPIITDQNPMVALLIIYESPVQ